MQGLASSSTMLPSAGCRCSTRQFTAKPGARRLPCRAGAVRAMAEPQAPNRPSRPAESTADTPARPSAPTTPGGNVQIAASVSIDYQRKQAKAMQKYFRERTFVAQAEKAQFFGWTKANEITNGRWVMFGFAVGLLTEFATGVDFPHQFGLMASYLGLLDFD